MSRWQVLKCVINIAFIRDRTAKQINREGLQTWLPQSTNFTAHFFFISSLYAIVIIAANYSTWETIRSIITHFSELQKFEFRRRKDTSSGSGLISIHSTNVNITLVSLKYSLWEISCVLIWNTWRFPNSLHFLLPKSHGIHQKERGRQVSLCSIFI